MEQSVPQNGALVSAKTVPVANLNMGSLPVVNTRMIKSALAISLAVLVAACSTTANKPAPVTDRSAGSVPATSPAVAALPGAENAGKPGYYTVKRGDTLIRIGLENGQSPRDLARWNNLENPNLIEVGQVLRVVPPEGSAVATAKPAAVPTPVRPPEAKPSTAPAASPTTAAADEELRFVWPVKGTLLEGFDEARNKGLDLGGRPGDPVNAAADGRVVYAGAGLRGYGNLIILKHNNTYLTAYAHNQTLLVKEDQTVRQGQKIAEMGSSDADRVKLHFEVRRNGKPVDPAKHLPPR